MPQAPHSSRRNGAYRSPRPYGCHRFRYPFRGRMPADQFSPSRHRVFRYLRLHGRFLAPGSLRGTTTSADFPRHFLLGISPGKSALRPGTTAAFTSATEPMGFAVLCQLARRVGLGMRFLFVSLPASSSLPSPGRLPFRSWLQVVVLSRFHVLVLLQGTCTPFTTRPCWAHTIEYSQGPQHERQLCIPRRARCGPG